MHRQAFLALSIFITFYAAGQDYRGVEVIRDKWGVPHIYAPTDQGVAYGLAWANAEDDFKNIQLTMLASKQMLGRYLGKDGAPIDYVVGLLRCKELARKQLPELSEDYLKVLSGYREGINAYAAMYPGKVLVKNAFPITNEDILGAYALSFAVFGGADRTIKALIAGNVEKAVFDSQNGSNGFAISKTKTADGMTYLAVNSHQPLQGPDAWYEAHLVSDEGWNAMGGLFPGGATIFHGTNEHLGWAHTVNFPDRMDVFQLEMHPEKKLFYKVDDEYYQLETRKVKLKIRILLGLIIGIKKDAYWSKYGPVIKNDKGYFAFSTPALYDVRGPDQWYQMNKAKNLKEFREALSMVALPGFNIVYADRAGNVYHLGNAKIPERDPAFDWTGTLPGNTSRTISNSYHSLDELPQNLNPESGFVFNTNNSAFSSTAAGHNPDSVGYDPTMGYQVWENNRSTRFLHLMKEHERLSYEDFLKIKYDIQLPDSMVFPIDLNVLYHLDEGEMNDKAATMLLLIRDWNRVASLEAIGPAQATILYRYLQQELKIPYRSYYRPTQQEVEKALSKTFDYFQENFDSIHVKLGDFQFLVRGDRELPIRGIDDVIAAVHSEPYEDGKYRAVQGESYIMMIRYPEEGLPLIETVNVYGASNDPESPHYDDQMEMFLNQERKSMTLDIEKVRKNAERIYYPGRDSLDN